MGLDILGHIGIIWMPYWCNLDALLFWLFCKDIFDSSPFFRLYNNWYNLFDFKGTLTIDRALELDINLRDIWKIIVLRNEFK